EEFISCKKDTGKLNNFNISVAVTEEFMQAVEKDATYKLKHPTSGQPVKMVRAREIFDQIVEHAHATAEPGIIFLDRTNESDPLHQSTDAEGQIIPGTEDIEATNPCGEQPLGPGDACNLGSINLSKFVDESTRDFNWTELGEMVDLSVRFLDDIIEA